MLLVSMHLPFSHKEWKGPDHDWPSHISQAIWILSKQHPHIYGVEMQFDLYIFVCSHSQ